MTTSATGVTTNGTTVASASQTVTNPNASLNKDAFLQLLVAQMKNQDPLQPQNNTQMVAQLAQFSALEQMTNVANTDSQILSAVQSLQTVLGLSYGHQMLGTTVTVADGSGNNVKGTVSAVQMNQGQPQVVVNNKAYPMSQVVQMS